MILRHVGREGRPIFGRFSVEFEEMTQNTMVRLGGGARGASFSLGDEASRLGTSWGELGARMEKWTIHFPPNGRE